MNTTLRIIAAAALLSSTTAFANCWGIGEKTLEVLRQDFRLESNNGPVIATVSYRVNVRHEVCESGGFAAGMVDQRKCASESRSRKFIRQITLTLQDGKILQYGASERLVDGGNRIEKSGPCTDHAKALTEEGFSSRIGTANTWAGEIQRDKQEIDSLLAVIGKINDSKIVFSL